MDIKDATIKDLIDAIKNKSVAYVLSISAELVPGQRSMLNSWGGDAAQCEGLAGGLCRQIQHSSDRSFSPPEVKVVDRTEAP